MLKRRKKLAIGGAVLAALALGSSASAGAATETSSASGRAGSVGATNHVRDRWIHDLYLTDHEQYVRHHERLASEP